MQAGRGMILITLTCPVKLSSLLNHVSISWGKCLDFHALYDVQGDLKKSVGDGCVWGTLDNRISTYVGRNARESFWEVWAGKHDLDNDTESCQQVSTVYTCREVVSLLLWCSAYFQLGLHWVSMSSRISLKSLLKYIFFYFYFLIFHSFTPFSPATTWMKSFIRFMILNLYSSYVQNVKVAKIITHEDYNSITKQHDIALLRLHTPLVFDECVRPVSPWSGDLPSLKRCTITGWGSTTQGRYLSSHYNIHQLREKVYKPSIVFKGEE